MISIFSARSSACAVFTISAGVTTTVEHSFGMPFSKSSLKKRVGFTSFEAMKFTRTSATARHGIYIINAEMINSTVFMPLLPSKPSDMPNIMNVTE